MDGVADDDDADDDEEDDDFCVMEAAGCLLRGGLLNVKARRLTVPAGEAA